MSPRLLRSLKELRKLYPPRATRSVSPNSLERLKGFVAQYKYDDIRTLILITPGGRVELMTRKRQPHFEYTLTPGMKKSLLHLDLDGSKYHVLDGGVIRHFSVGKERPIILWDILVHNDQYLVGSTYRDRYALLKSICGSPDLVEQVTGRDIALVISGNLWLAPIFKSGFADRYWHASETEWLEGLMLKNPAGKLTRALSEENNGSWQLKARKPKPGYSF